MSYTPYGGWTVTINGLTLGAGTLVGITEVRGLNDMPDVRTSDNPRAFAHGDYPGTDWMASRTIEVDFDGVVEGVDLTSLARALRVGDSELVIDGVPGLPAMWFPGRLRKAQVPLDRSFAIGRITPKIQFYAPDPLRYSAVETVLRLDLRETVGSSTAYDDPVAYDAAIPYDGTAAGATTYLTPPFTPPITPQGRPGMIGALTAVNSGFYPTAPVVRVYGPSPGFTLLQNQTNRRFVYTAPTDAGEYVEVDMRARTVTSNGTASRRAFKQGTWWDLPPGANGITFLPESPAVGAQVELRFRSAY